MKSNMYLRIKIILVILNVLMFLGCNRHGARENIDIEAVYVDTLRFSSLNLSQEVFRPRQIMLHQEGGTVTYYDDVENGVFKIFSYPENKFLFRYPELGNEKNKLSFIDESNMESLANGMIYLDYPYLREVLIDTALKTFDHQGYIDLTEINQDIHSVLILDDTLLFARNDFPDVSDSSYFLFSNVSNRVVKFFGDHPEVIFTVENSRSNSSFFRFRPVVNRKLKRIAIFYVKLNKVRIYNFDGKLLKDVDVGDFFPPQRPQDEMIYFESPVAFGNVIYVLYLNKNHDSLNSNVEDMRPELQMYNWEGELLKRYAMDASVYKFAIDSSRNKILAVTFSEENPVVEASILSQ